MVTLADLREYLNPAPGTTDDQLQGWLDAAKSEARTAGVPEFQHNAFYDLFLKALASWYYDNRGLQVSGTYQATARETMQKIKDAFVLQLRHAEEDPVPEVEPTEESGTETEEGGEGT